MKVCYLKDHSDIGLNKNQIYDVFCVESWGNKEMKFYVKGLSRFVYPEDAGSFTILNNEIPKFWSIGINKEGDTVIGPPEIYQIPDFWGKYYDDNNDCHKIVVHYHRNPDTGEVKDFKVKE